MRENFGQFSEERNKKLSMEQRSPRLLVSEHGMNSKVRCDFISGVLLCTLTLSTRAPLVMVFCHKIYT